MKKFFLLLFYLSFVFLVYYLYKADYLYLPEFKNYLFLLSSFLFLFAGMYFQNINWKKTLELFGLSVTFKNAFISAGLSVFMKYIPGKVMVVLGRAAYISKKYKSPLTLTSSSSLFAQVLSLWAGLLLGSILLFPAEINIKWKILSILTFIGLSLALLFPTILKSILNLVFKYLKKEIEYPIISYVKVALLLPSFMLTWLFWGLGFYFLALSLYGNTLPLTLSMAFPLAGSLAIVSLFAPGGLGVREGLLVSSMLIYNIPLPMATTIAMASRLWFLIGEILFFTTASLLSLKPSPENNSFTEEIN